MGYTLSLMYGYSMSMKINGGDPLRAILTSRLFILKTLYCIDSLMSKSIVNHMHINFQGNTF